MTGAKSGALNVPWTLSVIVVPEQKGSTRNGVELKGLAKERRKEGRGTGYEKAYNTIGYRRLAVEKGKKTRADFQIRSLGKDSEGRAATWNRWSKSASTQ